MKKSINILLAVCFSFLFVACSDDNEEARVPQASVTIDKTNLVINESMELKFTGIADQVVVFTGDKGHEYALRQESNTGYPMNKGIFTYSYATPGTFHVVVVASTYDTFLGENIHEAKTEFDVVVVDDVTTIDNIYTTITPNVYYAELVNDKDWVMSLPLKYLYNNKEVKVNSSKVRVSFDIVSDSSKIFIDDEPYKSNAYYNLTKVLDIKVVSNAGTTREYKLYSPFYPEFTSVKAEGVEGKLSRNAYYQDLQTYTFELPDGTDMSKVKIEYATDADAKFYAGGSEVASGSTIDLTNDNVEYTLVRTLEENTAVKSVSRIVFAY